MSRIIYLFLSLCFCVQLFSQTALQRSVVLQAHFQAADAAIQLDWLADPTAQQYTVYRKSLDDTEWGAPIALLPGSDTTYTDQAVMIGQGYEYALFKKEFGPVRDTFCLESGARLRFEINDMYNIGLCCSFGFGFYKLEACNEVIAEGSDFGTQQSITFEHCQSSANCEELIITIQPDIFPNSTSWQLYNDQTNELIGSSGNVGDFISQRPAYGYIYAGAELPAVHQRGSILLLVEDSMAQLLPQQIEQLVLDFRMDGWKVLQARASRQESVELVRTRIQAHYQAQDDLQAVYILGHVPVPYSGDIYPDTHTEHRGAWASDTYYGELTAPWTDTLANRATAQFAYNHNVPGDGRFDQDSIPSKMELAVGRVDFFDMPAFQFGEDFLLARYLQKSHEYKNGLLAYERKALIDDNFKQAFAAPAASGWRNFGPAVGIHQIQESDFITTLQDSTFLLAYGCGSGSHISSEGIGTTFDFANVDINGLFIMLFGSQFGDWDNTNNFLRAPLASGNTLTNCWAGNPPYTFHHMAMGFPIAYSMKATQNSEGSVYHPGPQLVHTALMGDPSLRLFAYPRPSNLSSSLGANEIQLRWNPSVDSSVLGYYVYRSQDLAEGFELVDTQWTVDTTFVDQSLVEEGSYFYMVRAVKLEQSGSGSFYNLSLGTLDSIFYTPTVSTNTLTENHFHLFPNPTNGALQIDFGQALQASIELELLDAQGRQVATKKVGAGTAATSWQLPLSAEGVYYIKYRYKERLQVQKIVLLTQP
ncbi:MAG: T9SS type A sorting domain-containing protein [Bacteroidota bacterium]